MRQITVDEARQVLLDALAEPHRLRVLGHLLERREANVSQLVDFLKLDQPHVSHHLRCLRSCGLVEARRDGRFVWYSLNGRMRIKRVLELLDEHASEHLEDILGCKIAGDHHDH